MMHFDNHWAFLEGWALFNDGEIQRLDCGRYDSITGEESDTEPVFDSDEEALEYVQRKANAGSPYHQEAIERLNMGEKNHSMGCGNSQPGDSSAFMVVIVVILVMAAGCYFGFIAN